MTDRDKLIELVKQSEDEWRWNTKSFANTVADRILEDGWVRLPCKGGASDEANN